MSDIIIGAYVRQIIAAAQRDNVEGVQLLLEEYGDRLVKEKTKVLTDAIRALNQLPLTYR